MCNKWFLGEMCGLCGQIGLSRCCVIMCLLSDKWKCIEIVRIDNFVYICDRYKLR